MRSLNFFQAIFLALFLGMLFTRCGPEEGEMLPDNIFTESALMANDWGIVASGTNAVNRSAEVAALFTDAEVTANGFSTRDELATALNEDFWTIFARSLVDSCHTNDHVKFLADGLLNYDYSDDCQLNFQPSPFRNEANYQWAMRDNELNLTENILTVNGQDSFSISRDYTIEILNQMELRFLLAGNNLLTDLGYNTAANPSIYRSYNFARQ